MLWKNRLVQWKKDCGLCSLFKAQTNKSKNK